MLLPRKLRRIKIFSPRSSRKPYNFYTRLFSVLFTVYCYKWMKHNLKSEFDQRQQPNILIPKFIYVARRDHYLYWELSRLARGKSTTFTHYDWDPNSQMIYYVARDGNQTFEKNVFSRERLDIIDNPLFESIFKKDSISQENFEKGNRLIAYHLNIDNRYDLDNYLHHKNITIVDGLRAIYYKIWLTFYLSNKYRYEHFIRKPDSFYNCEKAKVALNPQGRHQQKLVLNFLDTYVYLTETLIEYCGKYRESLALIGL